MEPPKVGVGEMERDPETGVTVLGKTGREGSGEGDALQTAPGPRCQTYRTFRRYVNGIGFKPLDPGTHFPEPPGKLDLTIGGAGKRKKLVRSEDEDLVVIGNELFSQVGKCSNHAVDLRVPCVGGYQNFQKYSPAFPIRVLLPGRAFHVENFESTRRG